MPIYAIEVTVSAYQIVLIDAPNEATARARAKLRAKHSRPGSWTPHRDTVTVQRVLATRKEICRNCGKRIVHGFGWVHDATDEALCDPTAEDSPDAEPEGAAP